MTKKEAARLPMWLAVGVWVKAAKAPCVAVISPFSHYGTCRSAAIIKCIAFPIPSLPWGQSSFQTIAVETSCSNWNCLKVGGNLTVCGWVSKKYIYLNKLRRRALTQSYNVDFERMIWVNKVRKRKFGFEIRKIDKLFGIKRSVPFTKEKSKEKTES